ncbi:unnamed protein product [Blepharisma stoltei]|uniref:Uncharacterized protein n=1 Tax=Blepharisma stoltei TaxID=1481888 RepID=A0AAU9KC89_9CILI|nr:unnamed protein product [Blepharisma stoltei]
MPSHEDTARGEIIPEIKSLITDICSLLSPLFLISNLSSIPVTDHMNRFVVHIKRDIYPIASSQYLSPLNGPYDEHIPLIISNGTPPRLEKESAAIAEYLKLLGGVRKGIIRYEKKQERITSIRGTTKTGQRWANAENSTTFIAVQKLKIRKKNRVQLPERYLFDSLVKMFVWVRYAPEIVMTVTGTIPVMQERKMLKKSIFMCGRKISAVYIFWGFLGWYSWLIYEK